MPYEAGRGGGRAQRRAWLPGPSSLPLVHSCWGRLASVALPLQARDSLSGATALGLRSHSESHVLAHIRAATRRVRSEQRGHRRFVGSSAGVGRGLGRRILPNLGPFWEFQPCFGISARSSWKKIARASSRSRSRLSLEPGKVYTRHVAVEHDTKRRSGDLLAEGLIERGSAARSHARCARRG